MKNTFNYILLIGALCIIGYSASFSRSSVNSSVYRISQVTDSFNHRNSTSFIGRHTFTYNNQGWPITDTWDYLRFSGKIISSSKFVYSYGDNGRLLSRISEKARYLYNYDDKGNLKRITYEFFSKDKWILNEETLVEETPLPNGGNKLVIILNKTEFKGSRKDSFDTYFNIEYLIDKNNYILKSITSIYDYHKMRLLQNYTYDNRPNPLQQIMLERWYDWSIDNNCPTNLLTKRLPTGKINPNIVYTYNNMGFPIKAVIDPVKTRLFTYEQVDVTPLKVDTLPSTDTHSTMFLYPNPAKNEVNIKANELGDGTAHVRIYAINGVMLKVVNYEVNGNLEALLTLNGLPKGTYIVEIVSPKTKISGKLVLL